MTEMSPWRLRLINKSLPELVNKARSEGVELVGLVGLRTGLMTSVPETTVGRKREPVPAVLW